MLAVPGFISAQTGSTALILPTEALAPGTQVEVQILETNPGATARPWEGPERPAARLHIGEEHLGVALLPVGPADNMIQPGGFAVRSYKFSLPTELEGPAILEVTLSEAKLTRGALEVSAKAASLAAASPPAGSANSHANAPAAGGAAQAKAVASTESEATPGTLNAGEVGRTFAGRITAHEPVYAIYGPKAPAAKFQFSFKYRIATFHQETEESAAQSLEFGYTQRSLWDVSANSSPFYDTSYLPELIYQAISFANPKQLGPINWYGFQAGYRHESNGQAGAASRSMNVLFARPVFGVGPLAGWHLLLLPQVYEYIGGVSDNPTIKNYRGYGEFRGVVGNGQGPALGFSLIDGKDFNHPTTQFDLTIPVHTKLLDTSLYLLVQYFHGYGESLRDYDVKTQTWRAGLSFVR